MGTETKNTKAFYNSEVPRDWEIKALGEIATFINGKAYKQEELLSEGKYKVLRVGNFFTKGEWYYSDLELEDDKYVNDGDLMYAWSASFGPQFWNGEKTIYHYHIWKVIASELITKHFLFFLLDYDTQRILSSKQGGTMFHITKGDMEKRKSNIPPLPEQKAIAKVLSTADAAIHTTEKLIAQKELRKKWLMQQLLTGKKRLLNDELGMMNDEWKAVRIGDVFSFVKSYSISRDGLQNADEGSVYCIHYGDIHAKYDSSFLDFNIQKNIPQLIDENLSIEEGNYLQEGDIVMADASEDYEGVGAAVEIKNLNGKKAIGGLHTIVLRGDKKTISPDFAAYFFASEKVRNTLRKYATGTSVYSVTKTQIHNLSFIIPNSLKEQTAIAQVLQSADKEISLLKAKAEKLREQKKGLMQVLLTGKVRLKIDKVKSAQ